MRLKDFRFEQSYRDRHRGDLEHLLVQPSDRQRRPCLNCRAPCGCKAASPVCSCACGDTCPLVPGMLTSEPDQPLEPAVVPVVYALSCLRLVEPCWSCEGHAGHNGRLAKIPRIWFFSGSSLYPDLIAAHLQSLLIAHRLNVQWQVALCPLVKVGQSVFEIAPASDSVGLSRLQQDLATIGQTLVQGVHHQGRQRLSLLDAADG